MMQPLVAVVKETLPWFIGNTFALAAWWVISGFLAGVFLSMFGGTIRLALTGSSATHGPLERRLGMIAGALIGMSGGATLGSIGEFSGIIGMVYLWSFVGIMAAAFQGLSRQQVAPDPFEEAVDLGGKRVDDTGDTLIGLLLAGWSRLGRGLRSPDEWLGVAGGGILGVLYGTITAVIVPLSATSLPGEDVPGTVSGGAAIWAVLGGFGGWVATLRLGLSAAIMALLVGLILGSSIGGIAAMVGELFGEVPLGALNGAIGGAFFGFIAAVEVEHKRFP
jgi:hypothetical protein